MWKTINYKGGSVTWYSEEEYEVLKTKYENIKKEVENKNNERKGNNLLK